VQAVLLVGAEQDRDRRQEDQRTADDAQHREPWRHQSGAVHQPAEQDAVDADAETRPEQERPVVNRDQGLPRDVERGSVRAHGRGQVVAQGDDGEQADRADPRLP
jgi:hypothetical protein